MGFLVGVFSAVALLAAAGFVYQAVGAARDRRAFAPPGRLVSVGSYRLHCRCDGDGSPAVVLDAGIAASSLTWSRVQPEIARFTRVCSYDRAGLAWSEISGSSRTMPAMVDELRALLRNAGVEPPFVLVGHSFGAMINRAFARTYPMEVAGIVLVDTLHPEEWCEPTPDQRHRLRGALFLSSLGALLARLGAVRLSLALLSGGAPGAPRRFSRVFGPDASALLENMVGEVQKLPADVLPAVQAHWSMPRAFHGMRRHLAALPSACAHVASGADSLGDTPLIVLSAGRRNPRWVEADAVLARASTRGRHIVSPHSGHWVHLDDPGLVVDAIREIVEQARGKRPTGG